MRRLVKHKLVKSLRSGEYEQGYDVLCKPGKDFDWFCVTGVIGQLWCMHTGNGYELVVDQKGHKRYLLLGEIGRLSPEILIWAGITEKESCLLADLNDGFSKINNYRTATFKWLAYYIEKVF